MRHGPPSAAALAEALGLLTACRGRPLPGLIEAALSALSGMNEATPAVDLLRLALATPEPASLITGAAAILEGLLRSAAGCADSESERHRGKSQ